MSTDWIDTPSPSQYIMLVASRYAIIHASLTPDNPIEPLLEPRDGLLRLDLVAEPNPPLGPLPSRNSESRSTHDDVKVHAENTDVGIVLDSEVNVLFDTEAEVAGFGEVALPQLILLNLQRPLQDLLGLGSSNRSVHRDLLITSDRESSDGKTGFGLDGGLTGELFENFGGSGESIAGFADADVDDKLLDTKLLHRVDGGSLVGHFHGSLPV